MCGRLTIEVCVAQPVFKYKMAVKAVWLWALRYEDLPAKSETECSYLSDVVSRYRITLLNTLLGPSIEAHFDIKTSVNIQMF